MVIAFDFDKVLTEPIIQRLALKLKREKNEVWVVTMRKENDFNKKVIQPVLDKLFLTHFNVIYCGEKPKMEMLKMINADIYIDNISDEFDNIKDHTNTVPFLFNH